MIPQLTNPIIVMNRPIPTEIAALNCFGIPVKIASLNATSLPVALSRL